MVRGNMAVGGDDVVRARIGGWSPRSVSFGWPVVLRAGVIIGYAHRQRIKPGITGWAQVNGFRGETSTLVQIEGRTRHDLYYIDNWSIFLDCWIIVLTVFSSKTRRNAV